MSDTMFVPGSYLDFAPLTRAYRKQGRFSEALTLFERAHKTRAKVLGQTHTHTLWLLGDIGATYQDIGFLKDAEDNYRRALDGRQDVVIPSGYSLVAQ